MSRGDAARLADILAAIERIGQHRTGFGGPDAELARDAVLYNLVIIGEAARGLTVDTQSVMPGVPWAAIIGLRNVLTHEYFRVSTRRVEEVLDTHLEALASAVKNAIATTP